MTIEAGLTQLQVDVAELADESQRLAKSVTSSLAEIDAVKGDIQNTHNFVDSNYQAMNDWQTKHGTVTFKNLQGQNKQVNTLSKLILDSEKINPHPHVMSKAQFDALRELRKQQYAGSGFVEWGKHFHSEEVNQGIWSTPTLVASANELRMGYEEGEGISRTPQAVVLIDGVSHAIRGTNYISTNRSYINFPPAPNGTKTYDPATGKVTTHSSAASAFEGMIANGDFRGGTSHWSFGPSWAVVDGNAVHTSGAGTQIVNSLSLTVGVEYEATFVFSGFVASSSPNTQFQIRKGDGSNSHVFFDVDKSGLSEGTIKLKWTATEANPLLRVYSTDAITIHSTEFKPVTEKVITSRKDLVFLETWHEKISDKDVVYPLGNVQYGGTTFDGMTMDLSPSGIAQGYSAFGEWDTTTNGRGHRWTTLIDSEKKKFIDNPENNIYYDSEADELIQVRYRVRVVEGLGDEWGDIGVTGTSAINYGNKSFVAPQGRLTVSDDFKGLVNPLYYQNQNASVSSSTQIGQLQTNLDDTRSHSGRTHAVPIALVQRMNQGAYHPTYNPMGCSAVSNAAENRWKMWYSTDKVAVSTGQMFKGRDGDNHSPYDGWADPVSTGRIGAPINSGRSDEYKYYDAIYAGQVEDLRLNANKLDVNQLREETMRKAVAGTLRGKGKAPFSRTYISSGTAEASGTKGFIPITVSSVSGDLSWVNQNNIHTQKCHGKILVNGIAYDINGISYSGSNFENIALRTTYPSYPSGGESIQAVFGDYLPFEFDSLPCVDIIGDPKRIAATFPDGVVGQWIPEIPDGSQLVANLNRKPQDSSISTQYTDNDGSNWSSIATPVNGITNTIIGTKSSSRVELHTYESSSNFTEPSNSSVVVGDVGNVLTTGDRFVIQGNRLIPSLIGLIGKDNQNGNQLRNNSVTNAPLTHAGKLWPANKVTHTQISLSKTLNNSPAVKALSTITEKDGLLYLQLHGAELKHQPLGAMHTINAGVAFDHTKGELAILQGFDSANFNVPVIFLNDKAMTLTKTSFNGATIKSDGTIVWQSGLVDKNLRVVTSSTVWGDDQVIPIVNGENVKTDLNGNTVKVFCHHTQIPLGIASN